MPEKQCKQCKVFKPISDFRKSNPKCHFGVSSRCKVCSSKRTAEALAELQRLSDLRNSALGQICTSCKKDKPLADFHKDRRYPSGHFYVCKECHQNYRKYRKERTWELDISRRYGMTKEGYYAMLSGQGGRCKICQSDTNKSNKNKYFSIDHDHVTGKVRGLLCRPCNSMLGMANDQSDTLRAAASYLESHKQ